MFESDYYEPDSYGGLMYKSDWDRGCENWCEDMANEFEKHITSILSDDDYVNQVCTAMAYAIFNGNEEDYSFLANHGMNMDHALCYLHSQSNGFVSDIENAYVSYLENKNGYD